MTDRELFEFIDVETMLRELGIRNVRDDHGGSVWYSCPFPGHKKLDSTPSASMSTIEVPKPNGDGTYPKTKFHCFACGESGNAIDFLAKYEGVNLITAKRFLRDRFALGYIEEHGSIEGAIRSILEEKKKNPPSTRPLKIIDESVLAEFSIDWYGVSNAWKDGIGEVPEPLAYMIKRGFTAKTLNEFDIGYDERSSLLTIPVRNADGFIIGFKGRAWWEDAHPRYKAIGGEEYGFDTYEMGRVLFALNIAKDVCNYVFSGLIVREGELNAMMLHQHGWTNAVGISGKKLSVRQQELIKQYAHKVSFWFDDPEDAAGAASHFIESMQVSVIVSDEDPAASTKEQNEEAILCARSAIELKIV